MRGAHELGCTRMTFHVARGLLDTYLSRNPNLSSIVSNGNISGLAAACLLLAAKSEEIEPSPAAAFARLGAVPLPELLGLEQRVLRVLNYRLSPSCYCYWAGLFLSGWPALPPHELFGIVDACTADVQVLQYLPRTIVAAAFYILLGRQQG
jgi:hypothetical protein